MKTYNFYKNELGWFIDLKWFPFNKAYCAMVAGADTLLDNLSEEKLNIQLQVSTKPFKNYDDSLIREMYIGLFLGSLYSVEKNKLKTEIFENKNLLWLCPVTLFVFLLYPKRIYFKKIK